MELKGTLQTGYNLASLITDNICSVLKRYCSAHKLAEFTSENVHDPLKSMKWITLTTSNSKMLIKNI